MVCACAQGPVTLVSVSSDTSCVITAGQDSTLFFFTLHAPSTLEPLCYIKVRLRTAHGAQRRSAARAAACGWPLAHDTCVTSLRPLAACTQLPAPARCASWSLDRSTVLLGLDNGRVVQVPVPAPGSVDTHKTFEVRSSLLLITRTTTRRANA